MLVYFISIWPTASGLSQSTVHPHLRQLAGDQRITRVIYFSFEQSDAAQFVEPSGKVEHVAIVQDAPLIPVWSRVLNLLRVRQVIEAMAIDSPPDFVICRGAPAGIYGHRLFKKFGVPYYVESFEPHAEYMRQSGTWSRFDIKYLVQRLWESKIKRSAKGLITVSETYTRYLAQHEGIPPGRLMTVPCWVDDSKFFFDPEARAAVRERLGIGDALVCVYLGKFGGLYHDSGVLRSLATVRDAAPRRLFIMVLTPDDQAEITLALRQAGFSEPDFFVGFVPHDQVNSYLSSADFAISFFKSGAWSFALSPIKHGEYWATGLPLIVPTGVGDESDWIDGTEAGVTADLLSPRSMTHAIERVLEILGDPEHRIRIREIGLAKRGKSHLLDTYDRLLESVTHQTAEAPARP